MFQVVLTIVIQTIVTITADPLIILIAGLDSRYDSPSGPFNPKAGHIWLT